MAAPSVPFDHPLYPPSHVQGPSVDQTVLAVKIAISRAGYWPWQEFDLAYNDAFAHGIKGKGKRFSGVHGFKVSHEISIQGDTYDVWTHRALLKTRVPAGQPNAGEWAFSPRAQAIYRGYEDETEQEKMVAEIFRWWDVLIANEPRCHYSQQRPIVPLVKRQDPPVFPNWLDCSGTVIYTCWLAGSKSPDPYGYSGYGNTNSLNDNGFRISLDQVEKYCKDHLVLAFYGPSRYATTHVTAVKSPTKNYSMGKEAGPEIISTIRYRHDLLELRAYEVI